MFEFCECLIAASFLFFSFFVSTPLLLPLNPCSPFFLWAAFFLFAALFLSLLWSFSGARKVDAIKKGQCFGEVLTAQSSQTHRINDSKRPLLFPPLNISHICQTKNRSRNYVYLYVPYIRNTPWLLATPSIISFCSRIKLSVSSVSVGGAHV